MKNIRRKKRIGHTLIEVLVASAIFLVFLSAVTGLFIHAIRAHKWGMARQELVSDARVSLDRISSDLKRARFILYPDEKVLQAGCPLIVFSSVETKQTGEEPSPAPSSVPQGGTGIFAYKYEEETKTVQFMLYSPDFDMENPSMSTVLSRRTVARSVESLLFKQDDIAYPQVISVYLKTLKKDDDQVYLMTKIFIRH